MSPMTVGSIFWSEPMFPKTAGPWQMPVPQPQGALPVCARRLFNSTRRAFIASAVRTALRPSSSGPAVLMHPHTAMSASPMNLSIVPWFEKTTETISPK